MKKPAVFFLVSFITAIATAQDSLENNSFFSFTAGPSFPLGAFASENINKLNAGLAKNGFALEAKYARQFNDLFGFSSAFVYARNSIKKIAANESSGLAIRPWEYYELLIGPMVSGAIAPKISMDLTALSGTAFINAPKVNMKGSVIKKRYSASAIPLKFAIDFRFAFNHSLYLFTGISYNYMRANFNVTVESQELSFKQSINAAGINAGAGLNFH